MGGGAEGAVDEGAKAEAAEGLQHLTQHHGHVGPTKTTTTTSAAGVSAVEVPVELRVRACPPREALRRLRLRLRPLLLVGCPRRQSSETSGSCLDSDGVAAVEMGWRPEREEVPSHHHHRSKFAPGSVGYLIPSFSSPRYFCGL